MNTNEDSMYMNYWAGVLSMNKEAVLRNLKIDDLKCLSNKDLCKLFRFLSCFFCCLDKFDDQCPCDKD